MNNRLKTILVIILLIAVVIAAVVFLRGCSWFEGTPEEQTPVIETPAPDNNPALTVPLSPTNIEQDGIEPVVVSNNTPVEILKASLGQTASDFAARYGSYSSQGNYENIYDLWPIMTPAMQTWAEAFIADSKTKTDKTVYTGVTSKALSATVTELSPAQDSAVVSVTLQRVETGSDGQKVYYQDAVLNLIKSTGSIWLVDKLAWVTINN